MRRTLLAVAAAVALLSTAVAADAPKLPPELGYVPADAALFVHLDIAALYGTKVGDAVKATKNKPMLEQLAALKKYTGQDLKDISTLTLCLPSLTDSSGLSRGIFVATFRTETDKAALTKLIKGEAERMKEEVAEKGDVITTTNKQFNRTQTIDLSQPKRVVMLNDLPETFLKPWTELEKGPLTPALLAVPGHAVVLGINLTALPAELRGDDLPAAARAFRPIFLASSATLAGKLKGDSLDLTFRVTSKDAANAGEVEKSLAALRTFAVDSIGSGKKAADKELDDAKAMTQFLTAVETMAKGAKFAADGNDSTATMTLALDQPWDKLAETIFGGNVSSMAVESNNLKQLAIAMHNYDSTYGSLPPAAVLGKKGKKLLSWRVMILPYVEQDALYRKFKLDEAWDSEHNLKVLKENEMPKVFAIPGTTNLADKKTHYQAFTDNGAALDTADGVKITDIKDGSSNTILIATAAKAVDWTKPDDIEFDPSAEVKPLLRFSRDRVIVAFADGSVRALNKDVSEKALKAAVTRSGGEVNNLDEK